MLAWAAIIPISSGLGYLLPAIIGLESMGIPSPGETALVLAAVLASQGKLQISLVIVIGVASAIAGDNAGYWLGRRLGREVLEAPGPFRKRRVKVIRAGDEFFTRHGPKAVFLARWIALVRFAAAWLAGINHMRFREFFFWNALGGVTWGVTYGLVGYYGGGAAANAITHYGIWAFVGLIVLAIAGLALGRWRERRQERALLSEDDGHEGGADRAPGGRGPAGASTGHAPRRQPAESADGSSASAHELMQ